MNKRTFPIDTYLSRLGLSSLPDATQAGLHDLVRAQAMAIPFENLDILAGVPICLDEAAIVDKLLRRKRGGYCYELNTLMGIALKHAGFKFDTLLSRVTYNRPQPGPLTHQILRVTCDGDPWLVDIGFGGPGLIEPMRMRTDEVTTQSGARFRLIRETNGDLHLQRQTPSDWIGLYRFAMDVTTPLDIEMANHFVSTYPRSPFRNRFMCIKPLATGMWRIDGPELIQIDDQLIARQRISMSGPEELVRAMRSIFGLELPTDIAERAWPTATRPLDETR
jgi:N-hydroxyarylamine O-acetyltransferase